MNGRDFRLMRARSNASVLHDASDVATASRLRMLSMLMPGIDDMAVS
jgi:hypothetical protein